MSEGGVSRVASVAGDRRDLLRSEQVASLYRSAAPGTVGSMIAGPVLAGMVHYVGTVSLEAVLIFSAVVIISGLARLILLRAYHRRQPPVEEWRWWARAATLSALAGGGAWGLASALLMDPTRADLQLFVILTCAGMSAGAITALGTYLPAYFCNLFTIMVPTIIWSALQNDAFHWTYAFLASMWIAIMAMLARSFCDILVRSLQLQFENLALANDLRLQKEVAEEANIAKSRFLASASHDLRQPVHAIGMFVGALDGQPMNNESRRLVEQIQGSIGSLGGLFNAILDVSRLDAGIVDVRPRAFPIQHVLEQICRDEKPKAKEKGVSLRLVPCSAIVRTDPVLFERILRNLISNAVRYTERGRIVIGCRRGERLSVEVWDTGPGIAQDQRDLIFEEFYQIGNPERSRSRGLGLGLAIVRRLTAMLDTPLSFKSEQGKGSVFKVAVPLGQVAELAEIPIDPPVFSQKSLSVLVIDDELEIQSAMQALLTAWGHSVVAAGSGDEMLAHLSNGVARPDLIISDYRLRGGENGIDTVRRVRARFDGDIPAILITGDTAPDRLRDAVASDCFLMHKPVANARLRAAIANMTASDGRPA